MNYQKDIMLLPNDFILFEQFMLSQEISCNNNKPINQVSYSFINQDIITPPPTVVASDASLTRIPYPCFFQPYERNKRKSDSKRYACHLCHKRFTRPSSLTTHIYSHTGEKPFKCPVTECGRQFSVVSNLRRYAKIHNQKSLWFLCVTNTAFSCHKLVLSFFFE